MTVCGHGGTLCTGAKLLIGAGLLLSLAANTASGGILHVPLDLPIGQELAVPLLDGESGFAFLQIGGCSHGECLGNLMAVSFFPLAAGFVVEPGIFMHAKALEAGALIGPDLSPEQWNDIAILVETRIWDFSHVDPFDESLYGSSVNGEWLNVEDRYLGFRALGTAGLFRYGWARLTVFVGPPDFAQFRIPIDATLTGYAVNLAPEEPILAGQTGVPEPSTWGMLALGLAAIAGGRLRRGKRRAKGPAPGVTTSIMRRNRL